MLRFLHFCIIILLLLLLQSPCSYSASLPTRSIKPRLALPGSNALIWFLPILSFNFLQSCSSQVEKKTQHIKSSLQPVHQKALGVSEQSSKHMQSSSSETFSVPLMVLFIILRFNDVGGEILCSRTRLHIISPFLLFNHNKQFLFFASYICVCCIKDPKEHVWKCRSCSFLATELTSRENLNWPKIDSSCSRIWWKTRIGTKSIQLQSIYMKLLQ